MAIGKSIANKRKIFKKQILYIGELASLILLEIEYLVAVDHHWMVDNDCCFMLIPVSIFLMLILLNTSIEMEHTMAVKMRNTSTIIYCVHGTVAAVLKVWVFVGNLTLIGSLGLFIITLGISEIVALLIIRLEDVPCLKWLRYTH